jgi:DNA-binding MarR family transcriptional regulator
MPTPTASTRQAHELHEILDAFRAIVQALRAGADGRSASPVTAAQLFALQQIAAHPDASVNEIAALTFTHQSSVSVVIQRLVDAGLVRKSPAGDRRRTLLNATARGKKLLARAPRSVQQDLVAALSGLSAADRRTLARLMKIVAAAVRVDRFPHPPMFFESPGAGRGGRRDVRRAPL